MLQTTETKFLKQLKRNKHEAGSESIKESHSPNFIIAKIEGASGKQTKLKIFAKTRQLIVKLLIRCTEIVSKLLLAPMKSNMKFLFMNYDVAKMCVFLTAETSIQPSKVD